MPGPDPDYQVLGAKIKAIRKRIKGMRQEDLAQKADLSTGQVSRIEGGDHQASLTSVEKIARALGVERDDLIEWAPSEWTIFEERKGSTALAAPAKVSMDGYCRMVRIAPQLQATPEVLAEYAEALSIVLDAYERLEQEHSAAMPEKLVENKEA